MLIIPFKWQMRMLLSYRHYRIFSCLNGGCSNCHYRKFSSFNAERACLRICCIFQKWPQRWSFKTRWSSLPEELRTEKFIISFEMSNSKHNYFSIQRPASWYAASKNQYTGMKDELINWGIVSRVCCIFQHFNIFVVSSRTDAFRLDRHNEHVILTKQLTMTTVVWICNCSIVIFGADVYLRSLYLYTSPTPLLYALSS